MMSFVVFFEQTFYTCGRSWQIHFLFKCSKEFGNYMVYRFTKDRSVTEVISVDGKVYTCAQKWGK